MTEEVKVKLSQWDALMVESLRGLGWSDDELIDKVSRGDGLPKDESVFHFDYGELAAYARTEPETFGKAVREGYQIKYNTVRGIRSWIWVAFGKEPHLELEEGREAVTAELTPSQLGRLRAALSFGWSIEAVADGEPNGGEGRAAATGVGESGAGEPVSDTAAGEAPVGVEPASANKAKYRIEPIQR